MNPGRLAEPHTGANIIYERKTTKILKKGSQKKKRVDFVLHLYYTPKRKEEKMLDKYAKTISIRMDVGDMYYLNRIKNFWEKDDDVKYTNSAVIKACLQIVCHAEDENRSKT